MPVPERGITANQEQTIGMMARDTRTLGQKFAAFLAEDSHVALMMGLVMATGFVFSPLVDLAFLGALGFFIYAKMRHFNLPFRMPMRSHCPDYNTPKPGSNQPSMAKGIYYFGNDRKTNDELWFTNDDMRTHVLIFGSTGSGKTEALVSIAFNALVQSSGFIYVDGKGDNSLFAKIFSAVRFMGREDDLLLINFMTGAKDIIGAQEQRLSNTMNPFSRGSSSMLTQLVVSLMDSGDKGGNGDMWKGRAIAFVEALMRVLVAMRDAGHILLDANTIRNYFSLERLESMVMDKIFIRDGQESVSLEDQPAVVMEPLNNYVFNLPGYNKAKKGKQVSQVYEQHGYITMQLTRVFSSLADTYGHIIRTNLPEVDLKDVVLNRRILVVLLPALEKSPDELSNLGKVIIASLKTMMASGLGDSVEGKWSEVIERKPTNARSPYLCILDEYGYYAVPGFAVVPAQARSLGFSVIFAGQDLPAFQKASKEEAASIGANTNIKICMKLEDPVDTWDFFMKSAGEAHVSVVSGYQSDTKGLSNQYMDSRSTQMEKRSRIDLLDLKEQREGESHILFKSRIVRARMFFANPKPVKELRINQFVKVDVPSDADLRNFHMNLALFKQLAASFAKAQEQHQQGADSLQAVFQIPEPNDAIAEKLAAVAQHLDPNRLIDGWLDYLLGVDEAESGVYEERVAEDELVKHNGQVNIFTEFKLLDELAQFITHDYQQEPLLSLTLLKQHLTALERAAAEDDGGIITGINELLNDTAFTTMYPCNKERVVVLLANELAEQVKNLCRNIIL